MNNGFDKLEGKEIARHRIIFDGEGVELTCADGSIFEIISDNTGRVYCEQTCLPDPE